ncbi:SET domain containing protein [Aphelenchoides avenae]|nr:SET domain containing protein [Aphelenchus avenae]
MPVSLLRQRVLCADISGDQEQFPVQVVNDYTNDPMPRFTYISTNQIDPAAEAAFEANNEPCECDTKCGLRDSECPCNMRYKPPRRVHAGACTDRCPCKDRPARVYVQDLEPEELVDVYIEECSDACRCDKEKCRNRVVQAGPKRAFQIFHTGPERGWGVRTKKFIAKDEFVVEYVGRLTLDKEDPTNDYIMGTSIGETQFCIDSSEAGNASRFINHSCSPNVIPMRVVWGEKRTPHVAFFARHDISEGEEIIYDYGLDWWATKRARDGDFYCHCESENCRYKPEQEDAENDGIVAVNTDRNGHAKTEEIQIDD